MALQSARFHSGLQGLTSSLLPNMEPPGIILILHFRYAILSIEASQFGKPDYTQSFWATLE